MSEIKFIYFEGCPNANKVRDQLNELGLDFEIVEQTCLPKGNKFKSYSSPTVLKGDEVIFGAKANGGGCSLDIPSTTFFRKKLC